VSVLVALRWVFLAALIVVVAWLGWLALRREPR
jgi:hypothetical protein